MSNLVNLHKRLMGLKRQLKVLEEQPNKQAEVMKVEERIMFIRGEMLKNPELRRRIALLKAGRPV